MTSPLLHVSALSKSFGSLHVLDEITFTLKEGEVVGLVGRRGAGKTSLLNVIAGVSAPTGGEIYLNGQRINITNSRQAHLAGIELVHEIPQLVEYQDVVSNIYLGRELSRATRYGIPDQKRMYARARDLFADFELPTDLLHQPAGSLTDELRQIVAIARALCKPPRLLMIDDAMASLSYKRQQILLDRIKTLAAQGSGIIICSENLKHLFSATNRILVLYEGRLIASRNTAECTPRDIVELIVGTSSREQVTPIVWALESFHAAQRQTEELYKAQAALHQSLEASDSLNRQLIKRLSEQVKALNRLNSALQDTQRRLMTEREEERKALARELHDQVIQDLLSFNYRLEETENELPYTEQREDLGAIREGIRQIVGDLRQLCQDLRPPTIELHGLPSAIRSLAQEWAERNNILLQLEIDPELGRMPEAIELSVFRIIQEGLNNVRKHADATQVDLTLWRTPMDSLLVRMADNGQGIDQIPDLADLSASRHFGLLGISERTALLGGQMYMESPSEGGLVLQVEIPSPYPSV